MKYDRMSRVEFNETEMGSLTKRRSFNDPSKHQVECAIPRTLTLVSGQASIPAPALFIVENTASLQSPDILAAPPRASSKLSLRRRGSTPS